MKRGDATVLDPAARILGLVQVKDFIPPDSVDEVMRTEEHVADGIRQLRDLSDLIATIGTAELLARLGAGPREVSVVYVLALRGGLPVGHLNIPPEVHAVPLEWVAVALVRGLSLGEMLPAFSAELQACVDHAEGTGDAARFYIGPVNVEMPASLQ